MSEPPQTGRAGRYPRTVNGLVGSMIVLVLIVLGIVVFRAAFRHTPSYEPEPVDYLSLVASIQQAGLEPAYPAKLPAGWIVKDATFDSSDRPVFDLAMNTDDDRFAGLHEEDASVGDLVDTYVGTDATEGDRVRIPGSVASTWQTFSDPGGDHAYAAELRGQTVLVYGSAPASELRGLVESLTTAHRKP